MRNRLTGTLAALTVATLAPVPASADGWAKLAPSFATILPGAGIASEGVGLSVSRAGGPGAGTISLALPGDAEIEQAFLYWNTYGGPDDTASFQGSEVRGDLIGIDGDTCWASGDARNYAYRASVTSLIGGSGGYSVGGIGGGGADPQGASLVVVHWDPSAPTVTAVRIADGMLGSNNQIFRDLTVNLPLDLPAEPLSAALHVGFGDGHAFFQDGEDNGGGEGPLRVGGVQVLPANSISGSDGPFWDDHSVAVPVEALGQTASLSINTGLDCFTWLYAAITAEMPDTIGPIVRGVPDRPATQDGWHGGPVTIHWQVFDGNGATQPPDTVADIEGRDVVYTSAPACDTLGNCSTGSLALSIDLEAPDATLRPFEFPIIGDFPVEGIRIFDNWVGGVAVDGLSGIDTVRVEVLDPAGGPSTEVPLDWIHCRDEQRSSCEFGAELPDAGDVPVQQVRVTAVDRAGLQDQSPVEILAFRPDVPIDECPLGPLCG